MIPPGHVHYPVDDKWKVGVATELHAPYAKHANNPEAWMGEVTVRLRFDPEQALGEDLDDVAPVAAAGWCAALGWMVGERPHVDPEQKALPNGEIGIRVTCLVSIPPYWQPPPLPGQRSLFEGDAA